MKELDKINYLNIGLMFIALGLAFIVPIQLFLLSYVILGPLHYLTEISWLKNKNFFMQSHKDKMMLMFAVFILLLGTNIVSELDFLHSFRKSHVLMLYIVFFSILGLMLFKKNSYRILFTISVCISSLLLMNTIMSLIFAVYLTTIIHVYVFTGMFILSGVIRNKSTSGIGSFCLFLIIPVFCFLLPGHISIPPNDFFHQFYENSFALLNKITLESMLGMKNIQIYENHWSISLSRFFAFAYTYHYLNWFSKTKIIKWHIVSKPTMIGIIVLWLASISLYFYAPLIGYKVLFILSYTHVLLEFPLNSLTAIHITKSLQFKKIK